MAADTAQKRYSAMSTTSPWRGLRALPSASSTQGKRMAALFLYAGIASSSVSVALTGVGATGAVGSVGSARTVAIGSVGKQTIYDWGNADNGAIVGLVLASDGNFYGTTPWTGASFSGTIFKLTKSGDYTLLHTFAGADGKYPQMYLTEAADGAIYGTTQQGGSSDLGTIWKITTAGSFTSLKSFTGAANGSGPNAGLIQATDGHFYGGATTGGANDKGVIWKLTGDGATLSVLHTFAADTDGYGPAVPIIQASDGDLYGATAQGSTNSQGALFKCTLAGTFTRLHISATGEQVYSGVIQANNGTLYGTTPQGGANNVGTIFTIDGSGNFAVVHDFIDTVTVESNEPDARLVQGSDGYLYGINTLGGADTAGGIFRFDPVTLTFDWFFSFVQHTGTVQNPMIDGLDGYLYTFFPADAFLDNNDHIYRVSRPTSAVGVVGDVTYALTGVFKVAWARNSNAILGAGSVI